MEQSKLSNQGQQLIKYYEQMATEGYWRINGEKVEDAFNDFELRKFRNVCKEKISNPNIKTVLDYGGGGSDWDAENFEEKTGESAKQFFQLENVTTFEPARSLMTKEKADCVVCMDVLEHIFIADIPNIVNELLSLSKKLLVLNVACYKAAALLPNGENAHITVRAPDWWKGVIDASAANYKDIEIMLICSTTFQTGIVYETFKAQDWHLSKHFTVDENYLTFGPN